LGEDLIMARALKNFFLMNFLEKVKYLEIGTCSPHWNNNTFYFYRKGARGVLVEPNPVFCREIKQIRPEDTLVEKGVSFNNKKSMIYYEFDKEEGRNTFEKGVADRVVNMGIAKVLRKTELPMVTINEILETYFDDNRYFDILQIDAEEMDFDIIKSMDFNCFHPKVVCMEMGVDVNNHIINYGKKDMICDYMQKINYECIASTIVNLIFIDTNQI
jgi:hypothetical protein